MKRTRPQTASIIIDSKSNEDLSENDPENDTILRNFSNFMRQIVENENDKFLTGDTNLIDYVLSKYLNIDIPSLQNLNKLSIKINGSYGLLNQFGQRLANLIYLKLNNSLIQGINDLGTNFKNLKIIQMNNCKLKDLGGLICFEHLEIFEAKNNQISDLIELEMCMSLKKLNLENNMVENIQNIYFLSSLDGLIYLNLLKNPIQNYEDKIKDLLPNLKELNIPNNDLCDEYYNAKYNKFNNVKISDSISTNNDSKSINSNKIIINCSNKKPPKQENVNLPDNNGINEDIEIISTDNENMNFMSINKSNNASNNNSSINFADTLNSTKTKFDFSISMNKLKPVDASNLNPVITKKKESDDIKLLRESFSRNAMNSTMTKIRRYKSNEKNFGNISLNKFSKNNNNNWIGMGKVITQGFNNNKYDKDKFKMKDKFLEEFRNKRLFGNK